MREEVVYFADWAGPAFNKATETIALDLWWNGQEIEHDGELVRVDTAWAIGVEDAA